MAAPLLRVHLADDHTMFREGLAAILSSEGGVEVVGQTTTGEAAAALIRETEPDVVITQLDMQLKEAEEILGAIRSASPDSKIVVLTLFDNLRYMQAIAAMGIDAILHKSSSAEELIDTLGLISRRPRGKNAVVAVLAARVLRNRQIAEELRISEATAKRHLANIYQKVGVRSRNEMVRKAMEEEWLGIEEITGDGNVRR